MCECVCVCVCVCVHARVCLEWTTLMCLEFLRTYQVNTYLYFFSSFCGTYLNSVACKGVKIWLAEVNVLPFKLCTYTCVCVCVCVLFLTY